MNWQKDALVALRKAMDWMMNGDDSQEIIQQAYHQNRWFEESQVKLSINQWLVSLSDEAIEDWLQRYSWPVNHHNQTLGLIMAGNIPLVGLHDLIVGVLTGYKVVAKLSSDDAILPKQLIAKASEYNSVWLDQVIFSEQLKQLDVAIATGSNNSARYFSAYFKNIPHIIRNHRNSLAVLSGDESQEEMIALGRDVFDYYGLGCRNVTHLMVPKNYDFTPLFHCWDEHYAHIEHHNKYINNYQYHRAMLLMNLDPHIDTGYLIAKENEALYAPVGMLNYSHYTTLEKVHDQLALWKDQLQCVVSSVAGIDALPFGQSQCTQMGDYADGVDTVSWLLEQVAVN